MTIQFQCPQCQKVIRVRDELAGRTGTCNGCQGKIKIPAPSNQPVAPARPVAAQEDDPPFPPPSRSKPADNAGGTRPTSKPGAGLAKTSPRLVLAVSAIAVVLIGGGIWWMLNQRDGDGEQVAANDAGDNAPGDEDEEDSSTENGGAASINQPSMNDTDNDGESDDESVSDADPAEDVQAEPETTAQTDGTGDSAEMTVTDDDSDSSTTAVTGGESFGQFVGNPVSPDESFSVAFVVSRDRTKISHVRVMGLSLLSFGDYDGMFRTIPGEFDVAEDGSFSINPGEPFVGTIDGQFTDTGEITGSSGLVIGNDESVDWMALSAEWHGSPGVPLAFQMQAPYSEDNPAPPWSEANCAKLTLVWNPNAEGTIPGLPAHSEAEFQESLDANLLAVATGFPVANSQFIHGEDENRVLIELFLNEELMHCWPDDTGKLEQVNCWGAITIIKPQPIGNFHFNLLLTGEPQPDGSIQGTADGLVTTATYEGMEFTLEPMVIRTGFE